MNDIDILKTSCKVFGLYFLIQTVISIRDIIFASTIYGFGDNLDDTQAILGLGGPIYQAIFNTTIGLILIFKSDAITQRLRPDKTGELKLNFEKTDWIELAIIIISTLTLLHALPEIFHKVVYYLYFNDYERNERDLFWTGKNKADVFYAVFKFGVALFFLLNARNFALRLKKVGDKDDKFLENKD